MFQHSKQGTWKLLFIHGAMKYLDHFLLNRVNNKHGLVFSFCVFQDPKEASGFKNKFLEPPD